MVRKFIVVWEMLEWGIYSLSFSLSLSLHLFEWGWLQVELILHDTDIYKLLFMYTSKIKNKKGIKGIYKQDSVNLQLTCLHTLNIQMTSNTYVYSLFICVGKQTNR